MADGGPAFPMPSGPEPRVDEFTHYNEGLSVRDYFAAKAMQGIITTKYYFEIVGKNNKRAALSTTAFAIADAMIKAREQ